MYRKQIPTLTGLALAVMALAIMMLAGCSSKSTNESSSGANVDVQISASPGAISITENTVVELAVLNGTTPVVGQTITFSVEPSHAGYFTPEQVTTDESGVAVHAHRSAG